MQADLVEILGGAAGQRHHVHDEAILGRDPLCQIVIATDSGVSRQHAKVFWTGTGWMVTDLGSRNGTTVNGQPLLGPTPLLPGDTVQISHHSFRLDVSAAQPVSDPTLAVPGSNLSLAGQNVMNQVSGPGSHEAGFANQFRIPTSGPAFQQQTVFIQGAIPKWIWLVLLVVVFGPCLLFCLMGALFSMFPVLLVLAGLAMGFLGLANFRRFRGQAGWEYHASRARATSIIGFVVAVLGLAWVGSGWGQGPPQVPNVKKPTVETDDDGKKPDFPEPPKIDR